MSQTKHSVESLYRCITYNMKESVASLLKHKVNLNQKLPSFVKFQNLCRMVEIEEGLEIVLFYLILSLSKTKRTKANIENILMRGPKQLLLTIKKFKIDIDNLDLSELTQAQLNVRTKIISQYVENSEKYWKAYEKKVESGENLQKQRKLVDQLFLKDKLLYGKEKRMNIKKKIKNSAQSSEESQSQVGSIATTGVETEQTFESKLPDLIEPEDYPESGGQNIQLRLIEQGSTFLASSSYWNCCLGGITSLDSCPVCKEFTRLEGLYCPYQDS